MRSQITKKATLRRKSETRAGSVSTRIGRPSGLSPGDKLDVMTLADVATYLHCHYSTAFRLLHSGGLRGFSLGSDWRFFRSEIDKWIAQRQVTPSEKAMGKPDGRGRKRTAKPRNL